MKMPFLESLPAAINKHMDALETDAEECHKKMSAQRARSAGARDRLGRQLQGVDGVLDTNDKFLDQVEAAIGDNGGPTSAEDSGPSAKKSDAVGFEVTAIGPQPTPR